MLPGIHHFSNKMTASFEPRYVRPNGGISFEIRRSMGGSIATYIRKPNMTFSTFPSELNISLRILSLVLLFAV